MDDGERTYLTTTSLPEITTRKEYLETILNLNNFQMVLFSTALIPRDYLDQIGLYDETLTVAEDWDLWVRLTQKYDFANVQQPLYFYRKHGGSLTRRQQLKNVLRIQLAIIEKARRGGAVSNRVIRTAVANKYLEFANQQSFQKNYAEALLTLLRGAWAVPLYLRLDLYRLLYGLARNRLSRTTKDIAA